MSKQQFTDFLDILESENNKLLKVNVTSSKTPILVKPLSFKQQKQLVTSGLDGMIGVMAFAKNLNDVILFNSDKDDLKIYDRIPVVLALRKDLSSKKIEKDDQEIDINDLIAKYKPFTQPEIDEIEGAGFKIKLRIPDIKQDNKFLSTCIEDLKKLDAENIGKNISLILSYEIPKFLDYIEFGDNKLVVDELSVGDRNKIMDNLPATITNQITEYILKVREYDEELLTHNGVTIDIDYTFFE